MPHGKAEQELQRESLPQGWCPPCLGKAVPSENQTDSYLAMVSDIRKRVTEQSCSLFKSYWKKINSWNENTQSIVSWPPIRTYFSSLDLTCQLVLQGIVLKRKDTDHAQLAANY